MVSPTLLVFVDLDRSGIGVMPFDLGLSAVLLVIRLGSGFWGEDHTGGVWVISSHPGRLPATGPITDDDVNPGPPAGAEFIRFLHSKVTS